MAKVKLGDELLIRVEKPGRYIGEEINIVKKDEGSFKTRFAVCFPDVYEVGMSHLGIKILYHKINDRDDCFCERVFAPWPDMESIMRENNIPLFSLESRENIRDFDFLGFTLQYELSYTNILNMLSLSGIPLYSKDREGFPFVICGGPCAYNPEPIADLVDFFVMGEAEEVIDEILDAYNTWKSKGLPRIEFLKAVSKIEGVYVPSFYDIEYNEDKTIKGRKKLFDAAPEIIKKRIVNDLNVGYNLDRMVVPLIEIVHDRAVLETFRGCTRGCRFCQAGMIYRPVREKKLPLLVELAEKMIKSTGYDEVSLSSLSICDYSKIYELVTKLIEGNREKNVGISLPSLRIDSFFVELINEIQKVRKTGLTFAPEAGTQRMRDVINKGVTEEDLINSTGSAFLSGWSTIKLYFMIGLPYEENDDVLGIADLGEKVVDVYFKTPKEKRKKGLIVTISTASFVPKPFTPFQWKAQDNINVLQDKQKLLRDRIRSRFIKYNYHDAKTSFLEAVFARGDRNITPVIVNAFNKGCKFDGWQEYFDFDKWMEAFSECNVSPEFYANRERSYDEVLPWDFIDIGVSKKFLILEDERAKEGIVTHDCRGGCRGCGITNFIEGDECFNGADFN